jgi:hypothetical protein
VSDAQQNNHRYEILAEEKKEFETRSENELNKRKEELGIER